MLLMSYMQKKRFRQGAAVGIEELQEKNLEARSLYTELLMHSGYIGFFDSEDAGLRVFVFTTTDTLDDFMKEARKIGFRTLGPVADFVYVSNSELQRPHLKYKRGKKAYYAELYK